MKVRYRIFQLSSQPLLVEPRADDLPEEGALPGEVSQRGAEREERQQSAEQQRPRARGPARPAGGTGV